MTKAIECASLYCVAYASSDGRFFLLDEPCTISVYDKTTEKWIDGLTLNLAEFAKSINPLYDDYHGWDDLHIAKEAMQKVPCYECPAHEFCEAYSEMEG